ncbi:MAG: superoxide dismutase family protein [Myxococcales bacterium]
MYELTKRAYSFTPWMVIGLLLGATALIGCERSKSEGSAEPSTQTETTAEQKPEEAKGAAEQKPEAMEGANEQAKEVSSAVATLDPTKGNDVHGTVHFEQTADGVRVTAEVTGLEPNTSHGFHIHEKGDCSAPDGTSAGGHYAPNGNPHGLPPNPKRHAGDMGNITADAQGKATMDETFDNFSLSGSSPVLGRAVIVHQNKDQGTQPTGDAGARVACGVIEAEK